MVQAKTLNRAQSNAKPRATASGSCESGGTYIHVASLAYYFLVDGKFEGRSI
jgi:hypothetical protein